MTINAQRVFIPFLNLHGYLVRVIPSNVPGGDAKYRVRWFEPALNNAQREANFFIADMQFETEVALAENGVAI